MTCGCYQFGVELRILTTFSFCRLGQLRETYRSVLLQNCGFSAKAREDMEKNFVNMRAALPPMVVCTKEDPIGNWYDYFDFKFDSQPLAWLYLCSTASSFLFENILLIVRCGYAAGKGEKYSRTSKN